MKAVPGWGTLPRMLRERAAARPDAPVVADEEVTLTVSQLREQAASVARALIALGVEPEDRVAVWAPNNWQWVVAAFGIWDAGAVIVPLSTRGKGIETDEVLRRTGARLLFVAEGFLGASHLGMLAEAAGGPGDGHPFGALPYLRDVVLLSGTGEGAGIRTWEGFLSLADSVSPEQVERTALSVRPDDTFEILCTSGTTGSPKGVMLSSAQILRAYWDWSEVVGLTEGDRYPIVSPFAHGFGINAGLIACVARLATMVPISVFDPDTALDLIEKERLTILAGPPNLFARILTHPDLSERDISSLRTAIVGAAAVPTELVRAMQERLGFQQVVNAYGLIEGTVVTMTRAGDPPEVVASTAGRPMPGVQVQITDDDGAPVAPGERGEVWVRGYGVMQGYWDAQELTAAVVDSDGWLRTGDVGVLDQQGNLAIVDRKKEMFIVGGFNAYPAEIENLLLRHPAVQQAAVVAVPDQPLGEVAWAYLIPRPGSGLTEEQVISWAKKQMSNYKVPRRAIVADELPVTANGKTDKAALRSRSRDLLGQTEAATNP
ncbi:AMP-binding protein [Streptomyces spiralis]|uniref:AMP-binding protein n=1 Tax=Streptomyces spiralis TaxID=66376 RepID=UPI00340FB33D